MENFEPTHVPVKGTYDRCPPPHKPGRRAEISAPYDSSKSTANRLQPAHVTGRHALPFRWTVDEVKAERLRGSWGSVFANNHFGKHVNLDKIFGFGS